MSARRVVIASRGSSLTRDLRAGGIVAVTTILSVVAYAALLASGPIAPLLPTILASTFLATAVTSLVLARAFSLPSALGGPAGNAAAVVGAALAAVVTRDPSATGRAADVAVVLALTALLPAAVLLALAAGRLGAAIRYVPYPVVAGFLAGTGWLLVVGGVRLAGPPGPLAVAIAAVVGLRVLFARSKAPIALPAATCAAIAAIWLALAVARVPPSVARAGGWLFARLPAAGPAVLSPGALRYADWGAIGNAWGALGWVIVVVVGVSMLNGSLLELETGVDERLERDLVVLGAANALVGVTGGFGSQIVLPTSLAANKLAPGARVPGYVVVVASLAAALLAAPVLPYLPVPVFAALLGYFGVRFLEQYVVDAARAMSRGELAIVVAMVLATAILGLKLALVFGLVFASVAFVAAASRAPVVRRETTLRHARSRVERSAAERARLDAAGDVVAIVRLQGHLFFGSASRIESALRPLVDRAPAHDALVLDFALVTGVDVSAAVGFAKLARRARRRGVALVVAGAAPEVERELRGNGAIDASGVAYGDLDAALEAHETTLLARETAAAPTTTTEAAGALPLAAVLAPFAAPAALAAGERLFAAGDVSDAMYLLTAGTLAVERDGIRLRTLRPGALVGEMGFSTGDPRSAAVAALEAATLARLDAAAVARMAREAPAALAALHGAIVRLQAERLRFANDESIALHV